MARADAVLFHHRERRKANLNLLPRRAAEDLQQPEWGAKAGAAVVDADTFTLAAVAGSGIVYDLTTDDTARLVNVGNIYIFDGFLTVDALTGADPWELAVFYNDASGEPNQVELVSVSPSVGAAPFALQFVVRNELNAIEIANNEPTKNGTITVNRLRVRALYPT